MRGAIDAMTKARQSLARYSTYRGGETFGRAAVAPPLLHSVRL